MHEETLVSGSSDIKQPQRKEGSSKVTVASRPESPTTKSSQLATHTHTHTHAHTHAHTHTHTHTHICFSVPVNRVS